MARGLQKQVITIPTGGGIDDSADPRLLDGPLMSKAENALLNKRGAYEKRRGFEQMSGLSLPGDTLGLNSVHDRAGQPLVYGHLGAFGFDDGADTWQQLLGSTAPVGVKRELELHGDASVQCYDAAVGSYATGNLLMETWLSGGVLWMRSSNLDTGAVILPPQRLSVEADAIETPHTVWLTGVVPRFYCFYRVADTLQYRVLDPVLGAEAEIELAPGGVQDFDVDVNADNTYAAIGLLDGTTGTVGIFDYALDDTGPVSSISSTIPIFAVGGPVRVYIQGSFAALAAVDVLAVAPSGTTQRVTAMLLSISTPAVPTIIGENTSLLVQTGRPAGPASERPQVIIGVVAGPRLLVGLSGSLPYKNIVDDGISKNVFISFTEWRLFNHNATLTSFSETFRTTGCELSHRVRVITDYGTWFGLELTGGPQDSLTRQIPDGPSDVWTYLFEPSKPYPAHLFVRIDTDTPGSSFEPREVGEFAVDTDPIETRTRSGTGSQQDPFTLAAAPIPVARVHHDLASSLDNPDGYMASAFFQPDGIMVPSSTVSRSRVTKPAPSVPAPGLEFNTTIVDTVQAGVLTHLLLPPPTPSEAVGASRTMLLNQQGGVPLTSDRSAQLEACLLPGAPRIEWVYGFADDDPIPVDPTLLFTTRMLVVVAGRDSDGAVMRSAPSNAVAFVGPIRRLLLSMADVTLRRIDRNNEYVAEVYWVGPHIPIDATLSLGEKLALLPVGTYNLLGEAPLIKREDGLFEVDLVDAGLEDFQSRYDSWLDAVVINEGTVEMNAQLYTEGGILEAQPPPPFYSLVEGADRAYAIDSERRYAVWVSAPYETGAVPRWNSELVLGVGPGTDLEALALLDDKLILFSRDGVFHRGQVQALATGEGLGGLVQPVPTDTGCIERTSVVTIPTGVLFRGHRGYYLLDRGLNVHYVGGPIEDRLTGDSPLTINAAVLVAQDHEVRISTNEGYIFVYHYLRNEWSTREGLFVHATTVNGRYHDATDVAGWAVLRERVVGDSKYDDPNKDPSSVTIANHLRLTTGWIKLNSLQGWGAIWRVMVLGETRLQPLNLAPPIRVTLAYDYDDTVVDTFTWPSSDIFDFFDTAGTLPIDCIPSQPRCEAIKIGIEELPRMFDASPEAPFAIDAGPAHIISGVTLEVGLLPGRYRHGNPTHPAANPGIS